MPVLYVTREGQNSVPTPFLVHPYWIIIFRKFRQLIIFMLMVRRMTKIIIILLLQKVKCSVRVYDVAIATNPIRPNSNSQATLFVHNVMPVHSILTRIHSTPLERLDLNVKTVICQGKF